MKFGISAATAALTFAAFAPQLALAGQQDFTLVNRTGYEIGEVYVAPSSSSDWEEDVLGKDTLANGSPVDITFSRSEDTCKWDLKVVYTIDNTSAEWTAFDLCKVSKITIFYDHGKDETSAEYE
jgi:hypothetical protein